MLNVLRGVPLTDLVVIQAVQEHRDVSPRQSRNRLLRDWFGPRRRERLHVLQAPGRQTTHARELSPKIRREAIHDPAAPALGFPALEDQPTDTPVQVNDLHVDDPRCSHPRRLHLGLDLLKQLPVPDWDGRLWGAAVVHPAILPDGADQ
jgi:hypothetical protein